MGKHRRRTGILGGALLLALATAPGCGREEAAEPAAEEPAAARSTSSRPSPEARQEAVQLFTTDCAPCHGANGAGNGPRSQEFSPRPRNFQDPEWQREMTDEFLRDVVVKGGAAVGRSDQMPAYPQLAEKPEVLAALVRHMRQFAR
jgi:mono/diheme cytochrome c family protein